MELEEKFSQELISADLCDSVIAEAKAYAPVDTGLLEGNIYWGQVGKNHFRFVCNVPYAIYMEYGTRHFYPNIDPGFEAEQQWRTSKSGKTASIPFMRPAIWHAFKDFDEYLKSLIYLKTGGVFQDVTKAGMKGKVFKGAATHTKVYGNPTGSWSGMSAY